MAAWFGVEYRHLPIVDGDKAAQEALVAAALADHDVDLVVLARYMQILSPAFCDDVGRTSDQHPPLVPALVQRRPPLSPGPRARRQVDRRHRPLRHGRSRRGPDHRPGRDPRQPPRRRRRPAPQGPRPRGRRARPRRAVPTSSTARWSTAGGRSSSTEFRPDSLRSRSRAVAHAVGGRAAWPPARARLAARGVGEAAPLDLTADEPRRLDPRGLLLGDEGVNGLPRNQRGSALARRGGPSTRIDSVAMAWPHDSTPLKTPDRAADVHVTIDVAVVAGMLVAHRRLTAIEHDPRRDPLRCGVVELDDDTSGRECRRSTRWCIHHVSVIGSMARGSISLYSQCTDHSPRAMTTFSRSLPAGVRRYSLPRPVTRRPALEDALALEVLEPLDEQRPGDARQATGDVVEPRAAEDQLAQDQRRPAIGHDLGAHRDGTELSVARHGRRA